MIIIRIVLVILITIMDNYSQKNCSRFKNVVLKGLLCSVKTTDQFKFVDYNRYQSCSFSNN